MQRTRLLFCLLRRGCDIVSMISKSVKDHYEVEGAWAERAGPVETPVIAARILRLVFVNDGEEFLEEWLRISGEAKVLESFIRRLKSSWKHRVSVIYRNRFSTVVRIQHEKTEHCKECPMLYLPPGVMPKTVILLPEGKLVELVAVGKEQIEMLTSMGFEILLHGNIASMDYMITPTQEAALIYAYKKGYYEFPRRTSLKKLAEELGISVSSLAELLRKAEGKIVEAFIRHELPHHLVYTVLRKARTKIKRGRNIRLRRSA